MYKRLLWSALLVFAMVSVASGTAQAPEKLIFATGFGEVAFDHGAHQQRLVCTTCHHTGESVACATCHGEELDIPRITDSMHMQCKGCHKESGGPTNCRDCHKK